MEFGQHQVQIFTRLMVILGAALVALICDLLKANNEQLRELAVELNVRRQEEFKRFRIQMKIQTPTATSMPAPPAREIALTEAPLPAASLEAVAPKPLAGGPSHNWGQILSVRRPPLPRTQRRLVPPDSPTICAAPEQPALPSGFQDQLTLAHLLNSGQRVTGLVVSIGVIAPRDTAFDLAGVCALIQSLLGPEDFAAPSAPDEFLLLYPAHRGAESQRKLSRIAEQLWDFQLSAMAALPVQFSWGGLEVRDESIQEAVASATERMRETRRSRKILTMQARLESGSRPEAPATLRRAV